jgi:hypothetical protein
MCPVESDRRVGCLRLRPVAIEHRIRVLGRPEMEARHVLYVGSGIDCYGAGSAKAIGAMQRGSALVQRYWEPIRRCWLNNGISGATANPALLRYGSVP